MNLTKEISDLTPDEPANLSRDPYRNFNPRAYIFEYYSEIGDENNFLLEFYHRVFKNLPYGLAILELGGGPTVYQLFSASKKATEIVFSDYLPCNLREVASWLAKDRNAFSWQRFSEKVALLEFDGAVGAAKKAGEIEERTRSVIKKIVACNALNKSVIPYTGLNTFDVVSSGFCLECISRDEQAFRLALSNALKCVKHKGTIILTMLKNSSNYMIGDKMFPSFPVDAEYIKKRWKMRIFKFRKYKKLRPSIIRDTRALLP